MWAEKEKLSLPSPRPGLCSPAREGERAGRTLPTATFQGRGSARQPRREPVPVGARPVVLPGLRGPSAPKVPGPASRPVHLRPCLFAFSPGETRGDSTGEGAGLPTSPAADARGSAPLSKRSRPRSPSKCGIREGRGILLAGHSRGPKVTGTWGPAGGLQGGGWEGGRQLPGRLRLGPCVPAPRARKGLENLPLPRLPATPLPAARIYLLWGWGR